MRGSSACFHFYFPVGSDLTANADTIVWQLLFSDRSRDLRLAFKETSDNFSRYNKQIHSHLTFGLHDYKRAESRLQDQGRVECAGLQREVLEWLASLLLDMSEHITLCSRDGRPLGWTEYHERSQDKSNLVDEGLDIASTLGFLVHEGAKVGVESASFGEYGICLALQ